MSLQVKRFMGGNMKSMLFGLMILCAAVYAESANAFTMSNGDWIEQSIDPLGGPQSAAAYFRNNRPMRFAANPGFGPESDAAFFWIFLDVNTGDLSLNMVFDRFRDGSGGAMELSFSGIPDSAVVAVANERNEVNLSGGDFNWKGFYNDGAVINNINGFDEITIDLTYWRNIDEFYFLSGDRFGPSRFALDPARPITIAGHLDGGGGGGGGTTDIPEPATALLLGSSLMFAAWSKRNA